MHLSFPSGDLTIEEHRFTFSVKTACVFEAKQTCLMPFCPRETSVVFISMFASQRLFFFGPIQPELRSALKQSFTGGQKPLRLDCWVIFNTSEEYFLYRGEKNIPSQQLSNNWTQQKHFPCVSALYLQNKSLNSPPDRRRSSILLIETLSVAT